MKSLNWLVAHDLSLTLDPNGRLWKFRPTTARHGDQPVEATLAGDAVELTVTIPGLESGDVDLRARGDLLEIRGKADRTIHLACDVGLPVRVELGSVETSYQGEELTIRVPLKKTRTAESITEIIEVAT